MEELKVEKRDGSLESYAHHKVLGSIIIAGATLEQAQNIADSIEVWVKTQSTKKRTVKTTEIREKILDQLEKVNPDAAKTFRTYRKPDHSTIK